MCAGTQWKGNVYEFVGNSFLPLWGTAVQEGLLPADMYLNATYPPTAEEAGLNIIHGIMEPYRAKWSYWFDYMSPNQWLLEQVDTCLLKVSICCGASLYMSSNLGQIKTPNPQVSCN